MRVASKSCSRKSVKDVVFHEELDDWQNSTEIAFLAHFPTTSSNMSCNDFLKYVLPTFILTESMSSKGLESNKCCGSHAERVEPGQLGTMSLIKTWDTGRGGCDLHGALHPDVSHCIFTTVSEVLLSPHSVAQGPKPANGGAPAEASASGHRCCNTPTTRPQWGPGQTPEAEQGLPHLWLVS